MKWLACACSVLDFRTIFVNHNYYICHFKKNEIGFSTLIQKFIKSLIIVVFISAAFAQNFSVDVFPQKKIYEIYFADAVSHQFSISKHLESREWFGNIGANLAIFDVGIFNQIFQLSAGATVLNTIIKTPGHIQVYTVDYLVDFYADSKITERLTGRFIFGHLSAHYSDDGIIELNNFPISYVRDYAGLHAQYSVPEINGKVYAGGFYNFHNEPVLDMHSTYQFGFDGGYLLIENLLLFAAVDIKIKSEVNFGTTQSYQAGLRFPVNGFISARLAYTHRRGFEERGQIFNQTDIKNSFGLFLDF
jgi:hypothetical protein